MEVIHGSTRPSSSTLNPNAPMFVPLAYRTVEDFSDDWWALVQSSPWFRDYWLRERFTDPQNDVAAPFSDFEMDEDALFYSQPQPQEEEEEEEEGKELVSLGLLKWPGSGARPELPRYAEKKPKFVKPKMTPRAIHQPR